VDQVVDLLAQEVAGRVSQHPHGRPIDEGALPLAVDAVDPFGGCFQQQAQAVGEVGAFAEEQLAFGGGPPWFVEVGDRGHQPEQPAAFARHRCGTDGRGEPFAPAPAERHLRLDRVRPHPPISANSPRILPPRPGPNRRTAVRPQSTRRGPADHPGKRRVDVRLPAFQVHGHHPDFHYVVGPHGGMPPPLPEKKRASCDES